MVAKSFEELVSFSYLYCGIKHIYLQEKYLKFDNNNKRKKDNIKCTINDMYKARSYSWYVKKDIVKNVQ